MASLSVSSAAAGLMNVKAAAQSRIETVFMGDPSVSLAQRLHYASVFRR
jgi:hypothetical protein